MIEVRGLTKRYGSFTAVQPLSFKIEAGCVVGLLGPNGAGKTTTMRMLTTYLAPSAGSASVAGFDINSQAEQVRKHIGYLPESPPLYPELRVQEYLEFVARIRGLTRAKLNQALEREINRCGLSTMSKRLCGKLSKGYRQRVGIAQALLHEPKVIILDEPTSGLDPAQNIEVRQLIRELGKTQTLILSTHILSEVEEVCSHVLIITNGQIVEQGPLDQLTAGATLEERFLETVLRSANLQTKESDESHSLDR